MRLLTSLRSLFDYFGGHANPPAVSSEPLRIPCPDIESVPPASELARLSVPGRHVVLQFPASFQQRKRELIEPLARLLPDHRVFDSGPGPGGAECVTVYQAIEKSVVLENLPLFLRAIRDFSHTANSLCRRLAEAHGVRPEDLFARRGEIGRGRPSRLGEWKFCFHGLECCFTSRWTGQVVDLRICFGDEFGVLDPYFLARFIRTTPAHREAARLLRDDFHAPLKMLEILGARGYLRPCEGACEPLGGLVCRGLVLNSTGGSEDVAVPERGQRA